MKSKPGVSKPKPESVLVVESGISRMKTFADILENYLKEMSKYPEKVTPVQFRNYSSQTTPRSQIYGVRLLKQVLNLAVIPKFSSHSKEYNSVGEFVREVYQVLNDTLKTYSPGDERIGSVKGLRMAFTYEWQLLNWWLFHGKFQNDSSLSGIVYHWWRVIPFQGPPLWQSYQDWLNSQSQLIIHKLLSDIDTAEFAKPFVTFDGSYLENKYYKGLHQEIIGFTDVFWDNNHGRVLDFKKIKKNIENNYYKSPNDFIADMLLMFQNCIHYFPSDHILVHFARFLVGRAPRPVLRDPGTKFNAKTKKVLKNVTGQDLIANNREKQFFLTRIHDMKDFKEETGENQSQDPNAVDDTDVKEMYDMEDDPMSDDCDVKSSINSSRNESGTDSEEDQREKCRKYFAKPSLNDEEMAKLVANIAELRRKHEEKYNSIGDFIRIREPNLQVQDWDKFEIDLEILKASTLRELDAYVVAGLNKKLHKLTFQKLAKSDVK